jgi:guanosine-3',5'-bis(diphosphate) 3'-pyrophosphohydrolase
MTTADDLIALVRTYNPRTNEKRLRAAFAYGAAMHDGQFRHSGEPYFSHPVAVTVILAQMQMDDATLITALLHDTIEDTKASYAEVEKLFGTEIAELVDGVTKLTNLQLTSTETKQAENFRKLFMATSRDLRVTLVKLADRLHNMRTIKSMRVESRRKRPARRWISMRRWRDVWACSGCAKNSRILPSRSSTPRHVRRSSAALSPCNAKPAM